MFTGLIREVGTIASVSPSRGVSRLGLRAPLIAGGLKTGDSLAVNGICLTVTQRRGDTVFLEAATETLRVTTLRHWRVGGRVHLEPSLRMGDPLDGHLVLGHVDDTGRLVARRKSGGSLFLTFGLGTDLARFLLPKGSVAVDGVSLTVDGGPFRDRFTVNVVPHTLEVTRVGELRVGEAVNLEMDVLVKAARGEPVAAALRSDGGTSGDRAVRRRPPLKIADLMARGFGRNLRPRE